MTQCCEKTLKRYIKKYAKKYAKKCIDKYLAQDTKDVKMIQKKNILKNIYEHTKKFKSCLFEDLQEGDIVSSSTMTWSQKYLLKIGFEEYNMTKYGILLKKDLENNEESIILSYDSMTGSFNKTNLYRNPGTSGGCTFEKFVE